MSFKIKIIEISLLHIFTFDVLRLLTRSVSHWYSLVHILIKLTNSLTKLTNETHKLTNETTELTNETQKLTNETH